MRANPMLSTVVCLLAAATTPCAAETSNNVAGEAFQKQVFGKVLDSSEASACFKRVYTSEHLKKHPQQNVRTMTLLVRGKVEWTDFVTYGLSLGTTFRQDDRKFVSWGSCFSLEDANGQPLPTSGVRCSVDCDGGALEVAAKDADSVLVSIPYYVRAWQDGKYDEEPSDGDSSRFGSDDKVFRLSRTALSDCRALEGEDVEASAAQSGNAALDEATTFATNR